MAGAVIARGRGCAGMEEGGRDDDVEDGVGEVGRLSIESSPTAARASFSSFCFDTSSVTYKLLESREKGKEGEIG